MVNDMTAGKPLGTILKMSVPIMAGNLFQQFCSMTDTVIVKRGDGDADPVLPKGDPESFEILWGK